MHCAKHVDLQDDQHKHSLVLQCKQEPCSIYIFELVDCLKDDDSLKVFENDKRIFAHVFTTFSWQDEYAKHCYSLMGNLTMGVLREFKRESGFEVYFYNPVEKWTLVFDHDGGIYYDK